MTTHCPPDGRRRDQVIKSTDAVGERAMNANTALVMVGAGLGGAKAAETLRAEGFDCPLI
jgi:hypothetical protein